MVKMPILTAAYRRRGATIRTDYVYMYDKCVKLRILNLPGVPYTILFENGKTAVPVDDVVTIPDELFLSGEDVNLFIVAKDGESEYTLARVLIPVEWRPARPAVE